MTNPLPQFADAVQLAAAFERLRAGASLIYATGPASLGAARNATTLLIGTWLGEGTATCAQGRDPAQPGRWLYKVYRLAAPPPPRVNRVSDPAHSGGVAGDRARVLALLAGAARAGLPCPSNEAIAEALDLRDARRVRYLFGQLVAAGAVRVIEPARFGPRVIEIGSTGQRTKAVSK